MRYVKKYDVRWSDLDVNRHMANFSYSVFMTDARISFLNESGFTIETFAKHNMGPVIFSEEFYYLKEIKPFDTVHVEVEVLGRTEDSKFMKLCHLLYNGKGELAAYSELFSSWFDLTSRKLVAPPDELVRAFENLQKSERFEILDKSKLKANDKVPAGKTFQPV